MDKVGINDYPNPHYEKYFAIIWESGTITYEAFSIMKRSINRPFIFPKPD